MSSSPQDTTSELIVRRLRDWGVARVYGYAGDGDNPLLGALRRAGVHPFIGSRHEESVASMAVGQARYGEGSGWSPPRRGLAGCILFNGLCDAAVDGVPVVAPAAQPARSVPGSGRQRKIDLRRLSLL